MKTKFTPTQQENAKISSTLLEHSNLKKLTPESTSVASMEYNAETKVFSITFKKGGLVYDYSGVPQEVALDCYNSPSAGKLPTNELKDFKGVKRG